MTSFAIDLSEPSRMQEAWWKSMILQVTLWSQPYMNDGDF